jgi:hypothetical protein
MSYLMPSIEGRGAQLINEMISLIMAVLTQATQTNAVGGQHSKG